jgi:uncharacterized cupredoxin-like copper-binding protein/quercetin dioxygenase-like cupin family protein
MRRTLFGFVALLLAVSTIVGRGWSPVRAQEATPAAGPISVIELAPGFTAEVFAGAPSDRAPDQTVYVARFVIQPGAEIFPHSHPGTVVLGVASGTLGWTLLEGTAHVVRGAAAGATGPAEDITEPGTEVMLEPGDAIFYEDDVVHTARGAGDEETVVLGTLVLTSGEPLLMPADMEMGGTPAAEAAGGGTVAVSLTEFMIDMPTELPAGPTTFEITNDGTIEHNFEVEGQGIEEELPENLAPGASGTLTVDLAPGTYEVYCPVGNHAGEGMLVEVTVTDG